jgi:predicted RecB family nuclease
MVLSTRLNVSAVPPQGGYIAKQCPVRIQNEVLRPVEPRPPSEEVLARMSDGIRFEEAVLAELAAFASPDWVFLSSDLDREAAMEETRRAVAAGAELIAGGWLPPDLEGRRTGKPDLLFKAAGGYVPVDVKHHLTLDPGEEVSALVSELSAPSKAGERLGWSRRKRKEDALQLAHYRRMLEACGWAAETNQAGIIGKEKLVVWYDLDQPLWQTPAKSDGRKRKTRSTMEVYDFEFGFRLDIAAAAQQSLRKEGELLVEPLWNSECPDCPWLDACRPVLEAGSGDPSLLPLIGYREWRILRDQGIRDRAGVASLSHGTARAFLDGADPQEPGLAPATVEFGKAPFLPGAILNARAAIGEAPIYRLPGSDGRGVPRADLEVDVDMESTNDGVYLWGALVSDRSGTGLAQPGYHPFVTWEALDEDGEREMFRSFWQWVADLRRRADQSGVSLKAYCWYASAENTQIRRLIAGDEELAAEVMPFIDSENWVDLEQVFRESWTTGGSRSLKVIAPLAGHTWSVDDPGGGLSMVRHQEATDPVLDPGVREAARDWLLAYNRGDVEATKRIREWLDREGSTWPAVPSD